MNDEIQSNIAETLAREMKAPVEIISPIDQSVRRVALPPGWTLQERDDEKLLPHPRRKVATVAVDDAEGFIGYMKRHGSLTTATIWCAADYRKGSLAFLGIINDHGEEEYESAWRDHRVAFTPKFSEEWVRWIGANGPATTFSQFDFAHFLEVNNGDIQAIDGLPSGAQMLSMALEFEANQDRRFKSGVRLQSGGQKLTFVESDDDQTIAQMTMFEKFSLQIPVFAGSTVADRLDARLRYRVRDGKLTFWYELIRPDRVLELAAAALVKKIREGCGNPFFFGSPFVGTTR